MEDKLKGVCPHCGNDTFYKKRLFTRVLGFAMMFIGVGVILSIIPVVGIPLVLLGGGLFIVSPIAIFIRAWYCPNCKKLFRKPKVKELDTWEF